ncbi:MAG TPA: CpsD/CapB family tyrosine-protein kinase [Bacteroidota bacterium]|nr:CpsD/CapB family tyrosine-protein kinase [Bacteroidota bacterium]
MANEENEVTDSQDPGKKEHRLVRLIKSVVENPVKGNRIDESVVKFRYFNSFNYTALAGSGQDVNLTLGITSANRGEGKTLVACNLAVSLAMGFQKKTILVDLNFAKPRVHDIFGLANGPGLAEAFTNGAIHVSRTSVEHLYVLNSGVVPLFHDTGSPTAQASPAPRGRGRLKPLLGLDQLTAFRDVIYSLEQEFDFVIVDMPSAVSDEIPVLFIGQLNGLLVVVDSGKTRKEDLDNMFQKINPHQVLGFVFNRLDEKG